MKINEKHHLHNLCILLFANESSIVDFDAVLGVKLDEFEFELADGSFVDLFLLPESIQTR